MTKEIIIGREINGRMQANFVYEVTHLSCDIWITKSERRVNAKSILGLLSISIHAGDTVELTINKEDAQTFEIIKNLLT